MAKGNFSAREKKTDLSSMEPLLEKKVRNVKKKKGRGKLAATLKYWFLKAVDNRNILRPQIRVGYEVARTKLS